jgi:8-oxo-dGTP diphosphatase
LHFDCTFKTIKKGNLKLKEHLDSKWLPLDMIESVDWAPADVPIMTEVKRKLI